MVVLSVSLLTRTGKPLLARQFVEMTRVRIEGLLTAFPKLLGGETRQHTFIDTESVRYVYQPIDAFFLLLITNKTSNIVEDLHVLQLLSKVVPDICGHLTEDSVRSKQFDLVFAFDEALTAGGHSDNINLQQIRTNMEMESHEEKLHMMIEKSKRDAAKQEAEKQRKRIREQQKEQARMQRQLPGMGSASGFGSQSGTSFGSSGSSSMDTAPSSTYQPQKSSYEAPPPAAKSKGMSLGGAKKGKNFMDAMAAEDDLQELPPMSMASTGSAPAPPVHVAHDPIVATLEEKISVQLNREGALEQMEVKGTLHVAANDPASAVCRLKLKPSTEALTFQTHPKVNKKLFESEGILGLKDPKKPFPESRVGVLRWGIKTQDESMLPLNITCWPEEESGGKMTVNLEYSLERDMILQNVQVMIPLGTSDPPHISSVDGEYRHDPRQECLLWQINQVSSENGTGSMEFSIRSHDVDAFFPISISFFSETPFCNMEVEAVQVIESNAPVKFAFTKLLTADNYSII